MDWIDNWREYHVLRFEFVFNVWDGCMTDFEFSTLAFWAFRYAIGRKSYCVSDVVDIVRKHIDKLDIQTREKMAEEIIKAINAGNAGMACDVVDWTKLLEVLRHE